MDNLPPIPVVLPLIAAALLTVLEKVRRHRRLLDTLSLATALAVLVVDLMLLRQSLQETIVYWLGNWHPMGGFPVGIAFVIDPAGAWLACLACFLTAMALIFSWHYFEAIGTYYHSLMLLFLASMEGFCLTGDLFNMFVFFELMGVAAYALTGYKIEDTGPLEGALNFAVMNSIGAFFVLLGLGIVYGKTGGLNLAWAGASLGLQQIDPAIRIAFALLVIGFLVKAAVVPFHFWLPDAHSVAPTPASVLFSGIMVELGLYAVARIYWTAFSAVMPAGEVRLLFLVLGVLTALAGAWMAFIQRHLKRLLAFSTASHSGLILAGLALLQPGPLAGVFVYIAGHGLIKGGLFICSGIILNHCGSIDEEELRGKCRRLTLVAGCYCISALALAGVPPFGLFIGKDIMEHGASTLGLGWLRGVFLFSSAVTGAAVLRAGLGMFFGVGKGNFLSSSAPCSGLNETREIHYRKSWSHLMLWLPIVVLVAAAMAVGTTGIGEPAHRAAMRFADPQAYQRAVLQGKNAAPAMYTMVISSPDYLNGFAAGGLAVVLALAALFSFRLPGKLRAAMEAAARPLLAGSRRFHSGHIGDYVTWFMLGAAILTGLLIKPL